MPKARIIIREPSNADSVWDAHVKNKVYNPDTLAWEAASNVPTVDLRRGQTVLEAVIAESTSGEKTIVSASATKKIRLLSYVIVVAGGTTLQWKSNTTAKSGVMTFGANGGISSPALAPAHGQLLSTAVNEPLILSIGSSVVVGGQITYYLEA